MLVLICFLTTPTRAYEAYKFNVLTQEQTLKNNTSFVPFVSVSDANVSDSGDVCRLAADVVEEEYQIKKSLLHTIASVESGRWDKVKNKRVAWPWTVHANGKGYYFNSKKEAIDAVKSMQAQGMTNIDVGCMQINLKYHGHNFKNLDEAFDPRKNVTYSAKFLRKLHAKTKSWQKSAMQYHSKNWRKGTNYKNRLEKHYAQYIRSGFAIGLF